ncbi:MAG: thiamine diphosphokinase [Treponema sp.]|nr:thiamine diphosphokinase [Treponema sp.]
MLGIIFTGGEAPDTQAIKQLVEKQTQKAEIIIAADSGFLTAQNAGVKPDWIIGDMDSLGDPAQLAAFEPERIIRHEHDKDYTDTELAFSLAAEKGCQKIWIIGGGGGRIDHLFGIRSLFERELFPQRWITDTADIYCIDTHVQSELSLCLEKKTIISVFPLGEGPWEAESIGLKWPLNVLEWDRGFFGLSNETTDDRVLVRAKQGRFMVILPHIM